MKSSDIHVRPISQEMPQSLITKIGLKMTYIRFHSNFPGANELNGRRYQGQVYSRCFARTVYRFLCSLLCISNWNCILAFHANHFPGKYLFPIKFDWNWTTNHDKSMKRTWNVLPFCEFHLCPRVFINTFKQSYLTWDKGMDTKLHPIVVCWMFLLFHAISSTAI